MKAITLWEPWASLIRTGAKTMETRSWETRYRGPLLICAAKGGPPLYELRNLLSKPEFQKGLQRLRRESPPLFAENTRIGVSDLNHGKMVARVNLVDCRKTGDMIWAEIGENVSFGDFTLGRYAWVLTDIIPVKTGRVLGHQGFFNVDDHLIHHEEVYSAT